MSKVVVKNISEITFTPRKPTIIYLTAKQWSEARKALKTGDRLPRNGNAIAVVPTKEGDAYLLPYCGEFDSASDHIAKPKYDAEDGTLSFVYQPKGKNSKDASENDDSHRRRRRQCHIAITTGTSPQFKCIKISCKGKCQAYSKELKTSSGQTIYYIYCGCGK